MYLCMYVYILRINVLKGVDEYIYMYVYVCMHVYKSVYLCMHICVCMYVLPLGQLRVGSDGGDTAFNHRLQTMQHLQLQKLRVRANLT